MKKLILLSTFFSLSSFAQVDICNALPTNIIKQVKLGRVPNYFFKISPDGKKVYYIEELPEEKEIGEGEIAKEADKPKRKNWVLDMETGVEARVPGSSDPVPSADGEFLTFVTENAENKGRWDLGVMPLSPAWSDPKRSTPISDLGLIKGSYQSLGPKRADGSRTIFYQDDSLAQIVIKDIKANEDGTFSISEAPRAFVGKEDEFKLPMMSEDGKFFSALNIKTNKTTIYELDGATAKFKVKATLPFSAGKTTFSPDGKKVAFHLNRQTDPKNLKDDGYPSYMATHGILRNVYTYDLDTKKVTQITDNVESDSYFPMFLGNGDIAYQEGFYDKDGDQQYRIVIAKSVPQKTERRLEDVQTCFGEDTEKELSRLGDLWGKVCKKWSEEHIEDNGIGMTAALNMPVQTCMKLAQDAKDSKLLKLCDALAGKKVTPTTANSAGKIPEKPAVVNPGQTIFKNRCAMCHEGQNQKIIDSPTLTERLAGKKSNRMPPMGPLMTAKEAADLKVYLKMFSKIK